MKTKPNGSRLIIDTFTPWSVKSLYGGIKPDRDLISTIEIFLNRKPSFLKELEEEMGDDFFIGILAVDSKGVWVTDEFFDKDDPIPFRWYLLPWHLIDGIVMHSAT